MGDRKVARIGRNRKGAQRRSPRFAVREKHSPPPGNQDRERGAMQ
jgi:hypothetical protein